MRTAGTRRPSPLLVIGIVAGIAIGVGIRWLTGRESATRGPDRAAATARFIEAHQGICAAAAEAAAGRLGEADQVFFDRSHLPLHDLSAAAGRTDRAASADLLEAKNRVEVELAREAPAAFSELEALARATSRALVAAGAADPGPCGDQ